MPSEQKNDIGEHLQTKGKEYGVTTGRKRRCGWLDLYQMKYSLMISGISSINLTKLDILDELEEIKIVTGYKVNGEVLTDRYPSTIAELEKVEPIYHTMKGWKKDTSALKEKNQLPKEAIA